MIIVRSPLRISLGGGGTDLPSYYRDHGGFLIAAAIDKYVYVTINRPFVEGILLKYSEYESVMSVEEVRHRIVREALRMENLSTPQIEITSMADIPAGTGLGSSGSFTTALLKALSAHRKRHLSQEDLAELACELEISRLGEPIGKQDQYIAALGGVTSFRFNEDDSVEAKPVGLSLDTMLALEENLLLFFTGISRSASEILKDQNDRTGTQDLAMLENLHRNKEIGQLSLRALESGDLREFGSLMHEHWLNKRARSEGISDSRVDYLYSKAIGNGAIGGKVVGAGGGGFLMFLAQDRDKLRGVMTAEGLEEVRFRFDFEGTKIVANA